MLKLRILIVATLSAVMPLAGVVAQESPVFVDHSPRAWELFRRAQDLAADNPGEAARLYQEILDDYALTVVPVAENAPDHMTSLRARVRDELVGNDVLLDRYRSIASAEAERLLVSGDLELLVRTRSLTRPGLDALLRLGQGHLESGLFHVAVTMLLEAASHPDLAGDPAVHCWYMLSLAAEHAGDLTVADDARARLEALPRSRAFVERLDRLGNARALESPVIGVSPLDRSDAPNLTDLVAQAIWTAPFRTPLDSGASIAPVTPAPGEARRRGQTPELLTSTTTIAGDFIYLNDGHSVHALDRFTGSPAWTHRFEGRAGRPDPDPQAMDLNVVVVRGRSLVTLAGHARRRARSSGGCVVCVDALTGALRWSVPLDGIDSRDDHEGLFPYGRPVVTTDSVHVLGRKVSDQQLTSCYVVSLDLATGALKWSRHVGSSGTIRRTSRPLSTLVYDRGALFVASNVGAVMRLDAATGDTRWLRRHQVPIHSVDQNPLAYELSGPVITPRGVLTLQQAGRVRRIVLMDRETGDVLETHDASTRDRWSAPDYLLADDTYVYAVGNEVRAFFVEDLFRPVWSLPSARRVMTEQDRDVMDVNLEPEAVSIRGRVQLTTDSLVVPTEQGVRILDRETGVEVHRLRVSSIGNPLAVDSQLFLAGVGVLEAYMSYARAEQMLRQRIAADPTNPTTALSLVRLGQRVENLDLILEAANLVVTAMGADPESSASVEASNNLLELLLDVADLGLAQTTNDGEALYRVIGLAALSPEQRVRHRLAYGDWLAARDPTGAAASYQAILSTPELASAMYLREGTVHPASDEALRRLRTIFDEHGSGVYAKQSSEAARQLARVLASEPVDPDRLTALAREYPLADAGLEACLHAAEAYRGDNRPRLALAMITRVLDTGTPQEMLSDAVADYIITAERLGWGRSTEAVIGAIVDRRTGLELGHGSGILAADWLADRAATRPHAMASVGGFDQRNRMLPGRVLRVEDRNAPEPTDRALLVSGTRLVQVDGSMETLWITDLEADSPRLLRHTDRDVLLWFGADASDPRAVMLDAATGAERWTTPRLDAHLGDAVRDLELLGSMRETMPSGEVFDPRGTIASVHDDLLIVARRIGGAIAFDLQTGAMRWVTQRTLDQVYELRVHDYGLVVAGVRYRIDTITGRAEAVPAIHVLDADQDGRVLHRFSPRFKRGDIRWMVVSDLGRIAFGTNDGIESADLLSGNRPWSNVSTAAMGSERAWEIADRVVVQDSARRLCSLNMHNGELSSAFDGSPGAGWEPQELRELTPTQDDAIARYPQRVVRYSSRGSVLGADAVIDTPRSYRWVLPSADHLVVVSLNHSGQAVDGDGQTERTYRIYLMSPNGRLDDQIDVKIARYQIEAARLIDGWVLLSTAHETMAVSMGG